ncbi:MAG: substrate-binding domain-containing protein [Chloroflexi bacterium]|nr:substrate-binding domain-containing protein [Chloroflexota bacterium]
MKKSISRFIALLVIATFLLSACATNAATTASTAATTTEQKGTIAISGAFALYPMMTRWAEEYQKIYPDVQFDVSAGGAGKGMTDALSNAVEIGMVSRDITPEEETQGAYWVPVVIDAVFPTINAENPVLDTLLKKPLNKETFTKIFITGEIKTWGDAIGDPGITDEIHVYTRSDSCGAAETWAKYLGGKQEDLLGIGVNSDPALLDAVVNDPLGIGYNNLNYAFDISTGKTVTGSLVMPIDVNENGVTDPDELLESTTEAVAAVAEGKYPAPPARKLNLVTNGKPEGIVQSFIIWVLTDGQQYVNESGYITLTESQIQEALGKVQ